MNVVTAGRTCVASGTVVKTGSARAMQIEYHKLVAAAAISKKFGLFRVPEVVHFEPGTGLLEVKRVEGLLSLNEALREQKVKSATMFRVGRALAYIHRELELPLEMRSAIPEHLDSMCRPKVFLHGDFNLENVCMDSRDSKLIILDWHTTAQYDGSATYGTPFFDLAWFLNGLFCRSILDAGMFPQLVPLALSFLRGYFGSEWAREKVHFGDYLSRFADRRIRERRKTYTWRRRVTYAPAEFLLTRFARNLIKHARKT